MTYESWRVSFQASEQAARAAYAQLTSTQRLLAEANGKVEELNDNVKELEERDASQVFAIDRLNQLIEERDEKIATLEAKDAEQEPVAWVAKGGQIFGNGAILKDGDRLYLSTPLVQSAVSAALRKAAEVCYEISPRASDRILAIPADETALRETLMKVAREIFVRMPETGTELESIVNEVLKGS